jgi:hypothetical protein
MEADTGMLYSVVSTTTNSQCCQGGDSVKQLATLGKTWKKVETDKKANNHTTLANKMS